MIGYQQLISIGKSCQCSYQLRRFTGTSTTSLFDWMGTPHHSLTVLLRNHFRGFFEVEHLKIVEDGKRVIDGRTGVSLRHIFSCINGQDTIDPASIAREYIQQRQKLQFLKQRWYRTIRAKSLLFVRQDAISEEQVSELYAVLQEHTGHKDFGILFIVPPGHFVSSNHPKVYFESVKHNPTSVPLWRGDNEEWDNALSKYWIAQH